MNRSFYIMITLAVLVLGLVGCGADPQKTTISESAPNQKLIVDLQDTIAQSRDNLEKEKERNAELMKRVQSLLEGLTEAEKRFSSLQKGEAGDISPEAERKRIELMGAKALAEFRAEQFRQRLDELAKDLDKKEKELETIRQNALDKDAEVQELRKAIDEIQRAERTRTQELSARLEQITRDLEERTAVASQFKKDLDEKNELLVTLKNAVADASKLKANAEAEIARLQNELSEVSKQLQASQSLAAQQDQDLTVAVNRTGQCQQEVQRLVVEVQTWQEETQRAQQETEKIKVIAQEWAEDAKQFKTDMERSRQEAEQFKAESNRSRDEIVAFRVETDRARQEAQDLRIRVWELSLKLQSVEAKLQSQEADKQSSVDKLLEHPVVTQERDPVSNLY